MGEKILTYKGKPLIRRDDKIYYGDFNDNFMIEMTILDKKTEFGKEIAGNILIELKDNRKKKDNLVKKAERNGLYKAMDIAEFWLLDSLGEV
ncbi:MAG: hypothetical protein WCX81_05955 [Monoglobales bacterium]